jgi:sugar/nucleoside kinase (ribokinase family)
MAPKTSTRPAAAPDVVVVGCPSLDTVQVDGRVVEAMGGAALYTAAGAAAVSRRVALYGLLPAGLPAPWDPRISRRIDLRHCPRVDGPLPRFAIRYDRRHVAHYERMEWGFELRMDPRDFPAPLAPARIAHVCSIGPPERQWAFLRELRRRGTAALSVGTYLLAVRRDPAAVRRLFGDADIFFCNEAEAKALFGPGALEAICRRLQGSGKTVGITCGAAGARVIAGGRTYAVPARRARITDPTGAGDTFCGAYLAAVARKAPPPLAAAFASAAAGRVVETFGPAGILAVPRRTLAAEARILSRFVSSACSFSPTPRGTTPGRATASRSIHPAPAQHPRSLRPASD